MKMRSAIVLGLVIATSLICFGQAVPAAETPGRVYEAWGGFSKLRGDFGTDKKATGWTGGVGVRFNRFLGLDATASGNYATADGNRATYVYALLLGPRVTVPVWRLSLFAHGGVGMARWRRAGWNHVGIPQNPPDTSLSIAKSFGLGADLRLTRRLSLRLLEADYIQTTFMTGRNGLISTGLVYRFK